MAGRAGRNAFGCTDHLDPDEGAEVDALAAAVRGFDRWIHLGGAAFFRLSASAARLFRTFTCGLESPGLTLASREIHFRHGGRGIIAGQGAHGSSVGSV